jgi:hypothetical protein
VTLTPSDNGVSPLGSTQLTVTLDIPALTNTSVMITATAGGTVPATVPITAGQQTATFTYTDDGTGTGTTTVTAKYGTGPDSTATVTVNTGADHLVINEVDYDQPSTDTTEFIEIYNPSATAKSLANVVLYEVNGSGSTVYATINLAAVPGGSLASHHYLVIAGPTVNVPAGETKFDPGWTQDEIQNGAPDGLALVDSSTNSLIDSLSYEGSITAVQLPGFAAPVSLVSGTATSAVDNGSAGSLCRKPNGQDTDMDSTDWVLCATTSPGADN